MKIKSYYQNRGVVRTLRTPLGMGLAMHIYVLTWVTQSHAQFNYKSCENWRKKLWQKNFGELLVICQIYQSFLPPKFLTMQ